MREWEGERVVVVVVVDEGGGAVDIICGWMGGWKVERLKKWKGGRMERDRCEGKVG